jgi:hypothetical protein
VLEMHRATIRWRKLNTEEIHDLYWSLHIAKAINSGEINGTEPEGPCYRVKFGQVWRERKNNCKEKV